IEISAKSPLDAVPTESVEKLLYTRAKATFHRSFEYCLAASDRALYFYVWGLRLRPRWVRIPLGEIERVVIAPYSGGRSRTIALVVILFGVVVGAHVLNQAWWVALLFGSLILYWGYVSIKSLRGRTEIIVKRGKTSFVFRSQE